MSFLNIFILYIVVTLAKSIGLEREIMKLIYKIICYFKGHWWKETYASRIIKYSNNDVIIYKKKYPHIGCSRCGKKA